ncbi:MAG: FkbM family methyltransferase [Acidobacteria bacterium]|nr:FkbM family methyltransferase [Acidobacteriota bacterium]
MALRLPARAVLTAARTQRTLERLGLGRLPRVAGMAARARDRWLRAHPVAADLVDVEMDGVELRVPGPLAAYYLDRWFDPLTTRLLRRFLRPGMRVVDVGAHIGFYTVLVAEQVGAEGHVLAVEPAGDNVALLRENVARFGAVVEVVPCAAGAGPAERDFVLTDSSDTHSFYGSPLQAAVRTVRVEQRDLDSLTAGPVDLVKIDVEGAEPEVLAGSSRLLAENRRLALLVEWNPACLRRGGHDPSELPAALTGMGFGLEVIDELAGCRRPLGEVASWVAARAAPEWWFCNLWAVRGA